MMATEQPDKSQLLVSDKSTIAESAKLAGEETRTRLNETLGVPADTESRELNPEQQTQLLSVLERRLSQKPDHYNRPEGIEFAQVKASLEAKPELMYSLAKMEETGGAPDIIAVEKDF